MEQNLLELTKQHINSIDTNKVELLYEYFNKSKDFAFHNESRGLKITSNSDNVWIDGEKDERNTYTEYIANDRSFIVRVDKYGIREEMIKFEGELFLELIEGVNNEIPVYRISCK